MLAILSIYLVPDTAGLKTIHDSPVIQTLQGSYAR